MSKEKRLRPPELDWKSPCSEPSGHSTSKTKPPKNMEITDEIIDIEYLSGKVVVFERGKNNN